MRAGRTGIKNPRFGKKLSKEQLEKISGENNHGWKGDKVSNKALHKWLRKHLPKPNKCQRSSKTLPYDVACIGEYKRDFENWEWICRSCHLNSHFLDGTRSHVGKNNPMGEKNSFFGRKHSPESIEKMRLAHEGKMLGRKHSIQTIEKIRQAHLGKKFSPEHIERIRQARLGKKRSEQINETR